MVQAGVADAAVKLRADGLRAQAERVRGVGQATRTAEDAEAELLRLRGKQSVGARLGEVLAGKRAKVSAAVHAAPRTASSSPAASDTTPV